MSEVKTPLWRQIFSRHMLICIFTGFSSGLPYFVLFQLIPAWLTKSGTDIKTISLFTLIGFPYTWKFIVAPLLDRYSLPLLGRRRGWMLVTQLGLLFGIMALGQLDPQTQISLVSALAALMAACSALQDIVIDAFRREVLSDAELGLGNSIHVNAYRISGLIPGGVSLILADSYPWQSVFLFTSAFMGVGIVLSLFAKEPKGAAVDRSQPFWLAFVVPFKEFFQRKGWLAGLGVIGFLFLYKFGDALATALQSKFLLDMGYSTKDLGTVVKTNSLWASISAGIVGGIVMMRIGINRALWLFGFVQLFTILGFAWLAHFGHFAQIGWFEYLALNIVISGQYIGVGLGASAFVAFMARETNPLYTATQLAIFTSLAAIPSKLIGALAGEMVSAWGYYHYFWFCFFAAIPGMLVLFKVAPWNEKRLVTD